MASSEFTKLRLASQAFSIDFHPTERLIGAGLITGQIKLFDYSGNLPVKLLSARPHKDACRALRFAPTGAGIFTAGSDLSLQLRDIKSNLPAWRAKQAHDSPVNSIVALGEVGVGSGDDSGVVKLWDLRTRKLALHFHENTDYIADMLYTEHKGNTLAVASGDGCLSVFDLRAGRLLARSDQQDDELLSLALLKGGRKLVCGCQSGTVGIFSWGDFGDVSDRLVGHPESVDAIAQLSDDVILTGSSDGMIRVVGVHPNKILGLVGEHEEMPVENLALDSTSTTLGSCSHDNTIRLWDVKYLHDIRYNSKGVIVEEIAESDKGEEDSSDEEAGETETPSVDLVESGHQELTESEGLDKAMAVEEKRKTKTAGDCKSPAPTIDEEGASTPASRKRPKQLVNKNAAISMPADFFSDM